MLRHTVRSSPTMVQVHAGEADGRWFGLAFVEERLVATSVAWTRHEALRFLRKSLPKDAPSQVVEAGTDFTDRTIAMLRELEAGNETNKTFELAAELLEKPLPAVLVAAAAIPIGYVTSYGNLAKVSGSDARFVGHVMARNPLYPIVPCHRVVGSDFSLVGYRGRTAGPELQAKLDRLRGEARGWPGSREVPLDTGALLVFPVERVIAAADHRAPRSLASAPCSSRNLGRRKSGRRSQGEAPSANVECVGCWPAASVATRPAAGGSQGREDPVLDPQVLTEIPPRLSLETVMRDVHVAPATSDARELVRLVNVAEKVARPKAIYAEAFVEARGEETVRVGGVTFESRPLRRSLDQIERVFPFVATCGHEVAQANPALPGDFLTAFWWDAIEARLLDAALSFMGKDMDARFRLGKTASMSPGAADASIWPIEQQKPLFELLGDVEARIGVRLTESLLMVPTKSVSGIRFAVERDFRSCQVCRRERCPSREASFDAALWAELQG
jgi:O-6-methylguanine DNA methyltransferase